MIFTALALLPREPAPAWTAESDQRTTNFGVSLASAGDVNGDGYADVIVGAPQYEASPTDFGRAFAYLGSPTGLGTTAAWTADGEQESIDLGTGFGACVAGAGDVNGDGYDDVIVTSPWEDTLFTEGGGRVWAFHGSAAGLDVTATSTIDGNQSDEMFGYSAASAGDVNADGFGDVVIGAYNFSDGLSFSEGTAFVYYGSAAGLGYAASNIESHDAEGTFGRSVASAGDVNGDGYDDVVIGAPGSNRAQVFHGSLDGVATTAAWTAETEGPNDEDFGESVASAGDVDGDGYADVIIGAPTGGLGSTGGVAHLYLGSAAGLAPTPEWSVTSPDNDAHVGSSVASAGDWNDDGYDDVLIGAFYWTDAVPLEGAAFVFVGSAGGVIEPAETMVVSGQNTSYFGSAVAPAGDVDDNGFDDFLVGARLFDHGQSNEGRAYLFAGTCVDPDDTDGDAVGDACDACAGFDDHIDADDDAVPDACDLCAGAFDPLQGDDDADGVGDACDPCPADPPDADADGVCAAEDCDDDDPTVYPGAPELCDGIDNACAGTIDAAELDGDGDGDRVCAGDCNDAAGDVGPHRPEVCGDAIDNDCDGIIDPPCDDENTSGPTPKANDAGCGCNAAGGAAGGPLLALALLYGRSNTRTARSPARASSSARQGAPSRRHR